MRPLRQIAFAILFAGWVLPALLAQSARAKAPRVVHLPRSPLQVMSGVAPPAPPPAPAERVATLFTTIAALWFLIALVYAVVLTVRLRRTLVA